jgi:hypothetical protein
VAVYYVACNCSQGHNITVSLFEAGVDLTAADCEREARELYRQVRSEIATGELAGDCPWCGEDSGDWVFSVIAGKTGISFAEAEKHFAEGSRIGTVEAMTAKKRRMN